MHLKCYQNVSEKKLKKKKIGNIEAKLLSRKRYAEGGKKIFSRKSVAGLYLFNNPKINWILLASVYHLKLECPQILIYGLWK